MKHRIVAFPSKGIAYNDGLYDAFRALGVEVSEGQWGGRWLFGKLRQDDVVHIHWPSFLYRTQGSIARVIVSFLRFVLLLVLLRCRTRHLWWTAHNVMPHTACRFAWLDRVARLLVIRLASRVFVHGAEARSLLLRTFPSAASKCVQIPHGHWIGFYPPCASRNIARRELGLPEESFVYLFFGQCKPYKNLGGLIEVFKRTAQADDILLVAGSFSDSAYLRDVLLLASGEPRIRVDHGFIPDDKVSAYFTACNALCMPYREILTSGTTMLALSYGRPVLSINRGFLRDVITPECGILIEPADSDALAHGMRQLRRKLWDEVVILAHASQFTFADAARRSLEGVDQQPLPA